MTLVSKTEFARHLGISAPRVSVLVRRGLPVRPDGKIDVDAAIEWMKANVVQQARFQDRGIHKILGSAPKKKAQDGRQPPRATTVPPHPGKPAHAPVLDDDDELGGLPYAQAKAARETWLAKKARLDFEVAAARFVAAEVVERRWTTVLADIRSRMLAVPSRCAARLGHLTQADILEVDAEVRAALSEAAYG